MQTVTAHISRRCRPLLASAVLVPALLLVTAFLTPAASGRGAKRVEFTQTRIVGHQVGVRASYGWPIKPFNRQHPVRGYLNDPRNGDGKNFHFGIDISAPDGTPVYAIEAGETFSSRGRESVVSVRGAARILSYWHVVPVVRSGQAVRAHQLLGHIAVGAGHVHLAERVGADYLNPLRPGGIGPYVDRTPPTVASVEFWRKGRKLDARALRGRVDIVVEAFDTTPLLVPAPWSGLPVTPARVRWSLSYGARRVVAPETAADFSERWLPPELYDSIYAPGTYQNRLGAPGHYRFYLAHAFRASRLPAGVGRLRIEASDTRGNRVLATIKVAAGEEGKG